MDLCTNLLGELTYLKMMNIKLNFSDLSRRYNVDRHTISKYYKNGGKIIKKRKKPMRSINKLKMFLHFLFIIVISQKLNQSIYYFIYYLKTINSNAVFTLNSVF